MAAYLIVDLDRLLQQFKERSFTVDLQEMAVALRGRAALAAGVSSEQLRAIAAADWDKHRDDGDMLLEQIFRGARYDLFDVPPTDPLVDSLQLQYFPHDAAPVAELILVSVDNEILELAKRVRMTRSARVRLWGLDNTLTDDDLDLGAIFQDLRELLGIESRNVALYIDFENIAISLSQQSFMVNLDRLIAAFVRQAQAHGHVIRMAAYAPWGNRGALPPLVDTAGNDVTSEAQSRLAYANIDPVYHLPGKNSADVKIANDVLTHSSSSEAAEVYIMATGDRDFNEVVNTLAGRGKSVLIWGVRGALSRQLSANPTLQVEYIEEFTNLETYGSRAVSAATSGASTLEEPADSFTPSQWSSLIVQFDRLNAGTATRAVSERKLIDQLIATNAVMTIQRGEDLVTQATALGILRQLDTSGLVSLNDSHPIVDKTRLIRDRIGMRVANTLQTRNWNYVNYGFLLKGLAMDRELDRPGLNRDDQWRSHWIDFLVREGLLIRELTPHHLNPEDLVPVIRIPMNSHSAPPRTPSPDAPPAIRYDLADGQNPADAAKVRPIQLDLSLGELGEEHPGTAAMLRRIIVSVEQFTSYRRFEWCPLGSLHQRLRPYDFGMTFQGAVEYLIYHNAVIVSEYPNPQSLYNTKGISLIVDSELVRQVLAERDAFIRLLLALYRRDVLISVSVAREAAPTWDHELWFSIMERENVLNALNGRPGFYSLFRTHHTVAQVAAQIGDFGTPPDGEDEAPLSSTGESQHEMAGELQYEPSADASENEATVEPRYEVVDEPQEEQGSEGDRLDGASA